MNPWKSGCIDCDREMSLLGKQHEVRNKDSMTTRKLVAAVELKHARVRAGQRKATELGRARAISNIERVRDYCQQWKLSLKAPKVSATIANALKISVRTAQRALQEINSK